MKIIPTSRIFHLCVLCLGLAFFLSAGASAQVLNTGFTYQGRLESGGSPANGLHDFDVRLFDSQVGGALLENVTRFNVEVDEGLFTVELDFGTLPFDGQTVWIEMQVRPAGSGLFTVLPRQKLTATPYSLYSDSAANADFLDGLDSLSFLRTTGGTVNGNLTFNTLNGIRSQNGARIETGPLGNTFHFRAGPAAGAAIAAFKDAQGETDLMVDESGLLRYLGGQKICSVAVSGGSDTWRDTLVVPGGWSASTCASYMSQVQGAGSGTYYLGCVFDTTFKFGAPNGGIPSPNCGW